MSAAASRSSSSSRGTAATGSSPSAQLLKLTEINNMELFAAKALTYIDDLPDPMLPTYHVLPRSKGDSMLSWDKKVQRPRGAPKSYKDTFELYVQIQDIGNGFARIGAIGDGNCMVHSMFTAVSPTYRAQTLEVRQAIADRFRDVLAVRIDELRALADIIYVEQGGAVAFYDAFENLENSADRTEIDMELGPVIGQLFGFNYIAARLDHRLRMLPVVQSLIGRRPDLPTVFIHYTGGATEGGAGMTAANFGGQGHYEVIVRPVVAGASGRASSRRGDAVLPASGPVVLDEVHTTFMFTEEALAGVLAMFGNLNASANMSPKTQATFLASVERKRAEGIPLSPATLRTLAALEKKMAAAPAKKSSSSRKSSSNTSAGGSNVSPRTLAAILALEKKKTTSARRSTRKASPPKPVGGAGAAPARRSERHRKTTQKKKLSSSGSNLSPGTLEAILAMEAMNLKGGVPNLE